MLYNPNNDRHVKRLGDAIDWSQHQLRPFRKNYLDSVLQYAGHNYGEGGAPNETPINMVRMAVDVYLRNLVPNEPQCKIVSKNDSLSVAAYELELAANHCFQEMNYADALADAITTAIFGGPGVLKVGITQGPEAEIFGVRHNADQPYCDAVLFDDLIVDMAAKRFEDLDFIGNRFQASYDALEASGLYENLEQLSSDPYGDEFDGPGGHVSDMQQGSRFNRETYHRKVELCEIWLPFDKLILTMRSDCRGKPLRVIEDYEGPEVGPYLWLNYNRVLGNLMPASMAEHIKPLHRLLNMLFKKLGDQALDQKTFYAAGSASASNGDASRMSQASDGEVIHVDNPSETKEIRHGGADQQNLAFALGIKELVSYLGGNIDTLAGLGQQAETLGQEKLLAGSASQVIEDMKEKTAKFVRQSMESVAYWIYSSPSLRLELTKPGNEWNSDGVPFVYDSSKREADFWDYNLQVIPYSLRPSSPDDKISAIMRIMSEMVFPAMPMLQQQGIAVKFDRFLELIANYTGLHELNAIIESNGAPIGGMYGGALPQGQLVDANQGSAPMKPNVSTRRYVRTNVTPRQPGSGTDMLQSLLGAGASNGNHATGVS